MSDEEDFSAESHSDFSASEDEWLPTKVKAKKGAKAESSSEDDDDTASSAVDSDLEDFVETNKKKAKKATGSRKRPAPKPSPKAAATGAKQAGGGKKKRLSPGLRDRLYQQYKKDLLKEVAPVRAPVNSSVSDILSKCQYQRKSSIGQSQSKANDSDSSGDDHLVDPEKLDLRSTFFAKSEATSGGTSGTAPHFDVNAGMRLSDSSDGEQGEKQATGEEFIPASIPKQAADQLISHINQQSGEFMNFHNLDQFTTKLEEAKQFLKSYQQKETAQSNAAEQEATGAASLKDQRDAVSNLLALGEVDAGVSPQKAHSDGSSDSEWEEVQATTKGNEQDSKMEAEEKPPGEAGWQVTIEMDTAQSRRKRREELEMELFIKRQINKVKRANQLNYHKSSILCAVAIGQQLHRTIGSAPVRALLLSIMQDKCSAAKSKWDDKRVQHLADWFGQTFSLQSNDYMSPRNGCGLGFNLSLALYTRRVSCRRDYILLFLACLRMAGAQARIVLSASVPTKRPALSDLCPMSERQRKETNEKRHSNNVQQEPPTTIGGSRIPKIEATEVPKPTPQNVPEMAELEQKPTPISPAKENAAVKDRESVAPPNRATRKTTRKALVSLNIPQLDGGDDAPGLQVPPGNAIPPLRRSLRSRSATAASPPDSPGLSPFAKRKSNTPGASAQEQKSRSATTRKRELFPKPPMELKRETKKTTITKRPAVVAVRSSARKQQLVEPRPVETGSGKLKQKKQAAATRSNPASEDEAFESKRPKVEKSGKTTRSSLATTAKGRGGDVEVEKAATSSSQQVAQLNSKKLTVVVTDVLKSPPSRKVLSSDSEEEPEGRLKPTGAQKKASQPKKPQRTVEPRPVEPGSGKLKQKKQTAATRPNPASEDEAFESKRPKIEKSGKTTRSSLATTAKGGGGDVEVEKAATSWSQQVAQLNSKKLTVVVTDVLKSPPSRKVLSSDSEEEPEGRLKLTGAQKKASQPKKPQRTAAARKGKGKRSPSAGESSGESDSDFELPGEASGRRKKSPTAAKKVKKSPAVRRGRAAGERMAVAGDKTDLWIEWYCEKSKRWITFDLASGRSDCVDFIVRNATSPISYVFCWDNHGLLKDITARYVQNWNTACRMLRVDQPWLDKALAPLLGAKTERDVLEDKELSKLDADKPLPKTITELKNHPLYVLRRHLLKFEALYPPEPPTLGFIRGEAIYPRECVHKLQTREKWYKQGRVVRPFETAYKVVKCWKYDRPTNNWLKDQPCDIFGLWQTDEYDPPTAENGVVPRNEYGNVELFTEKMLPKGTVHLKLPGLNKICKRLQIDCAPALTGFDMAKMRVVPVYEGFVVCQEFAEQVVEEWYKEMEQEEAREQEKMEKRVYGNWKRLIKGLLVRRKLQNKYNFDNLA